MGEEKSITEEQVKEEYEINEDFKRWVIAYCTYKSMKLEDAFKDSTVIYSAKDWKRTRERKEGDKKIVADGGRHRSK